MKNNKTPHKEQVVTEMKNVLYSEIYKAEIIGKRAIFDKKWNTILNFFSENK